MAQVTIWHNPRCTKSRQTLALLEENGVQFQIRSYLIDVPTEAELAEALKLLGLGAAEFIRHKETAFKAMELSKDMDDAKLITAMTQEPKLIERPVVFANGKAAIGRPPGNVLAIL